MRRTTAFAADIPGVPDELPYQFPVFTFCDLTEMFFADAVFTTPARGVLSLSHIAPPSAQHFPNGQTG